MERHATRRGNMPPPVPERVANTKIREDRAVQDFRQNSEKMHRATSKDAYTKAWFHHCRSIFRTSAAPSSTTWVHSIERVNIGKLRILKSTTLPAILSCHFSQNSGETTTHM